MVGARIEEGQTPCFVIEQLRGSESDIDALQTSLDQDGFVSGIGWLIDNRELCSLLSTRDVVRIVAFAKRHHEEIGRSRVALVVSSAAAFGMGRMLEALADCSPLQVRTFRGMADARGWLER